MERQQRVVCFDGDCSFCNRAVQFILRRDAKGTFRFATLKSEMGKHLQVRFPELEGVDSVVLLENENIYVRSTAVLRIAKQLDGFWKHMYLGIIIPKPIRDVVYDWVAKHRYLFIRKNQVCMLLTEEQKNRFMDNTV